MSTKRSKKIVVDASAMNNDNKKVRNVADTAEIFEDASNALRKKKKEDVSTMDYQTVKPKIGKKRKLSENDVGIPSSKKSKKRGKTATNLSEGECIDYLPCEPTSDVREKESKKGSKKKKYLLNNEETVNNNGLSDSTDVSHSFIEKVTKKKNKSSKAKVSNDQNDESLIAKEEVDSDSYDKIDVQEEILKFKEENINYNNDFTENGNLDLSTTHFEDSKYDLDKDKLVTSLVKKKKKSGRPKIKGIINWSDDDLKKLVERMEACIPEQDTLAFGTRAEKLEWDAIAFNNHSVEECKETWFLLQRQIRRFRLLREVLADAKEWIVAPKNKKQKRSRHPDMPRKPLTAYFIYYLQKKDHFSKTHPGLDATEISKLLGQEFKNLPPEKRLKYENLAIKKRTEYQTKLEEFYQLHPDIPRAEKPVKVKVERKQKAPKPVKPPKIQKERAPKRPAPPFHNFYLSELEKQEIIDDRLAFKESCKERWKQLPDDEKVVWINKAELEYEKYEKTLMEYSQNHPDSTQNIHKPVLTKEELQIKDRVAGKPSKPPNSAYNLYVRAVLQSEDIKKIPIRDRLNYVSSQWKICPEETKKHYRDLSLKMNEKYKLEFASYLETLPEEERKVEIEKNAPKRRKSECVEPEKKEKAEKKQTSVKKKVESKPVVKKLVEPEQPPFSAFKYFASLYDGKEPVSQAWKALSVEQKKVYENELVKKKQIYILEFEKFLKSLSKEELEEFSNSRRIKKAQQADEATETSDESGTEDSGAEEDSNEEDEKDSE